MASRSAASDLGWPAAGTGANSNVTDGDEGDRPALAGPGTPAPPARPGLNTFTIEGRAAPALFVVGWLTSILGLALVVVGVLSQSRLLVFVGAGFLSVGLVTGAGSQAIERRARRDVYAGPSPILVLVAVIAVANFVGVLLDLVLSAVLRDAGAAIRVPLGQLAQAAFTAAVFIGVLRLTVVGTGALSWTEMRLRRLDGRAAADLAFGAAMAVPVIAVTLVAAVVLVSLFRVVSPSPLPPTGTTTGLLIQLVAGAIIAPLAEEIIFRGFAITAWERSIGPSRAVIRASILFALAHVISIQAGSFSEAIGLIAVGIGTRLPVAFALGWLFVRRRSIWASVGLHATFNAVLLIIANASVQAGSA
jgi:membrane protease YdiL (CAAX protease family)